MAYKIIISPRALKEIENAIDYYKNYSSLAPINFINSLKNSYLILSTNPFYQVVYKNVRIKKLKKFPYSLYFEIIEAESKIRILSCFHTKRNPNNRPNL